MFSITWDPVAELIEINDQSGEIAEAVGNLKAGISESASFNIDVYNYATGALSVCTYLIKPKGDGVDFTRTDGLARKIFNFFNVFSFRNRLSKKLNAEYNPVAEPPVGNCGYTRIK